MLKIFLMWHTEQLTKDKKLNEIKYKLFELNLIRHDVLNRVHYQAKNICHRVKIAYLLDKGLCLQRNA